MSEKRSFEKKHPPYRRTRVSKSFDQDEGRTHQSFKDQCDINKIFARFVKTGGNVDHINPGTPMYGDFTHSFDLRDSIERVSRANAAFAALPAAVRDLVNQDPAALLDAIADPEQHEALAEAGFNLGHLVPEGDVQSDQLPLPGTPEPTPPKPSEAAPEVAAPSEA